MTFEYLSQLCQNKEQVFSQPGGPKDSRGEQNALQNLQLETCFTIEKQTIIVNENEQNLKKKKNRVDEDELSTIVPFPTSVLHHL